MIGAFARMVGRRDKVVSIEERDTEGIALRTKQDAGYAETTPATDAPPEQFVHKISDEGGDVFVVPVLEALREALRRVRGQASAPTPEETLR